MQKQINQYTTLINFQPGSSFAQRETILNREILKIQQTLRNRGFYPIDHKINAKTDSKASITFNYYS
jgi:hypothetical protein